MFKSVNKLIIFTSLILLYNCSLNKMVVNSTANFFQDGMDIVYQEGDLELARDFLGSNLKTIEVLLSRDPDNQKMNLLAAQSFGAYAMAFVQDQEPERAKNLYKRALNYAFRSLPDKIVFHQDSTLYELDKFLNK